MPPETLYYHHGEFKFRGGTIPDAVTAYRIHGDPSNPCIVFPTCYGGRLDSQYYLVGDGKTLDTSKYFVVTFALFSNGESSSPSNTHEPFNGVKFPQVTYEDNIRAQHAVLTKELGVKKIHAAIGFSMGGQQAYYWAIMFPEMVERFICICGSARTSPHNKCFLEGPKAALVASADFQGGNYLSPPETGIRAFGRVYSAWAYGQTWFRQHEYLYDGKYPDLDSWLEDRWAKYFIEWDGNDLLTLLDTWQNGDISLVHHGDSIEEALKNISLVRDDTNFERALKSIKVKGLIMPAKTDLYFPRTAKWRSPIFPTPNL